MVVHHLKGDRAVIEDRFLRIREAARYLGVSRVTVYNWQKARLLPLPIKLGPNTVGYRRSDLDAFIASRAVKTD